MASNGCVRWPAASMLGAIAAIRRPACQADRTRPCSLDECRPASAARLHLPLAVLRSPEASMPNLFEEFRTIVAALGAARVPYALCGGIAMSIHARPRATVDIDLLAPPGAVPALITAVAPLGFTQREREPSRLADGEVLMHRL